MLQHCEHCLAMLCTLCVVMYIVIVTTPWALTISNRVRRVHPMQKEVYLFKPAKHRRRKVSSLSFAVGIYTYTAKNVQLSAPATRTSRCRKRCFVSEDFAEIAAVGVPLLCGCAFGTAPIDNALRQKVAPTKDQNIYSILQNSLNKSSLSCWISH